MEISLQWESNQIQEHSQIGFIKECENVKAKIVYNSAVIKKAVPVLACINRIIAVNQA